MNDYRNQRTNFLIRIRDGICSLKQKSHLIIYLSGIIVFVFFIILKILEYRQANSFSERLSASSWTTMLIVCFLFYNCIIFYCFGKPTKAYHVDPLLRRSRVDNGYGESPLLRSIKKSSVPNVWIYEFYSYGTPLSFYEDHQTELESALNILIDHFEQGYDMRSVLAYAVKYDNALPQMIPWSDNDIDRDDFILNLGVSIIGKVRIDLNDIPHMLIGGSTGSGKSVLLKTLIYQCAKKNATVIVADFKGGIEFLPWKSLIKVYTDIDSFLLVLMEIMEKIKERMELFREYRAVNLPDYISKSAMPLKRIIIACDEVAELLDKSGLSKSEKESVEQVERLLSTIARQGRAFGIHLILATQRPDATILNGQIRNNIDFRACGRADDVLSKIILDNTDASERIPKYERGLFLTNDNKVFRGYYFTNDDLH